MEKTDVEEEDEEEAAAIHTRICVCIYICVCTFVYLNLHVYMRIYIYIMYVCACRRKCIYLYIYIDVTDIQPSVHIHTSSQPPIPALLFLKRARMCQLAHILSGVPCSPFSLSPPPHRCPSLSSFMHVHTGIQICACVQCVRRKASTVYYRDTL